MCQQQGIQLRERLIHVSAWGEIADIDIHSCVWFFGSAIGLCQNLWRRELWIRMPCQFSPLINHNLYNGSYNQDFASELPMWETEVWAKGWIIKNLCSLVSLWLLFVLLYYILTEFIAINIITTILQTLHHDPPASKYFWLWMICPSALLFWPMAIQFDTQRPFAAMQKHKVPFKMKHWLILPFKYVHSYQRSHKSFVVRKYPMFNSTKRVKV